MIQTIIDLLNEARLRELEAVNQYMIHHDELENRNVYKLASQIKEIAMVEMKHAEKLTERILFLQGEPILEPPRASKAGQEIPDMLATDIALETQAIKMYSEAATICAYEKDQHSKELFEEFLGDEEGHLNCLKDIKYYVDRLGAAYIATLTGK